MMRLASLFLVVACFLTGCSNEPKTTLVKGKIVKGGQPLAVKTKGPVPPGQRNLSVELIAEDGRSEPVGVDEDNSSFTVLGATGKGVKAGKYKVVVFFYDPGPPNDQLRGMYSHEKTKLTVTIEDGKSDLGTIDLDNPPK